MPSVATPQTKIDQYLAELRTQLRSLPHDEMVDIVEEIHSHIRDAAGEGGAMTEASINAALSRLGTPSALAASYVTDNLLARAERNRMPWTILRGIFRWATLSVKGFLVFMVCLVGYIFGASFFIAALAKPLTQRSVSGWWTAIPIRWCLA